MSSVPAPQEIWKDARWLGQAVDPNAGLVRLVEMTREDYRDASFLDDRMLTQSRPAHLVKWQDVASTASANARSDARWIFHIGHVGSTLISRLLGELDTVLAVREPRALRDLTFFPRDVRDGFVPTVRQLMSRTFADDQAAVVKATSFVSEIAGELTQGRARALILFATPRSYISGILAGENSRKELSGSADMRRQRLTSRLELPQPRSEADAAAIAWACEMTALEAADGPNCLWTDFDRILGGLQHALKDMVEHLEVPASDQMLSEIANGPLTRRYSKATEYEYNSQTRRDLLAQAHALHRADIEAALAMLNAAAETSPVLRKSLDRAQAES